MFSLGPSEMVIVGIVAVLLFGKRLPDVGRSLGKSLMEFKRGLQSIQDDMNRAVNSAGTSSSTASSSAGSSTSGRTAHQNAEDREEATAPKFVPPTAEPQTESAQA